MLTHERRGCTVVSNGFSEMWSLSKEVLEDTMLQFPELVPKLNEFVVVELERKRRLYMLAYRIVIGCTKDKERRAALILQKAWSQFTSAAAKAKSHFGPEALERLELESSASPYKRAPRVVQQLSADSSGPSLKNLTGHLTPPVSTQALNAQLKDMANSLNQIKRMLDPKQVSKLRTPIKGAGLYEV